MIIVTSKRSDANIGGLFRNMNFSLSVFPDQSIQNRLIGESKIGLLLTGVLTKANDDVVGLSPTRSLLNCKLIDHNCGEGCVGTKHT